ncbi:hypothetical protein LC085_00535 [Bacillus tianshenii]|uniref:hypothetical protein n=1 Tax=Sutcliffiella tianshenii TaxID=1463404 RepID=UPI001CD3E624|nr:hypothetical protein [Bacillus tianshenii]MCA1318380.1 hypothetical protein [Bacillus tianshenii]
MLDSIEQLEKEIETFHQNVAASNNLYKLISTLIEQIKKQEEEFSHSSTDLLDKISASTITIQENNNHSINELISRIHSQTSEFSVESNRIIEQLKEVPATTEHKNEVLRNHVSSSVRELERLINSIPDQVKSANILVMRNELEKFKAEQDRYIYELGKVERTVTTYKTELEMKHSAFLSKIESTNIEQIHKLAQETKDSMNKRFTLLFAGLSVTIVLLIVSFFY